MKRSTAKKTEKPVVKESQFQTFDDSAWFDVMRATLSPYWSARMEYMNDRAAHRDDKEAA